MRFTHKLWVARATLYAFAAMGCMWGAYVAMIPDVKGRLGVSDAVFGTLLLASPLMAAVAMLLAHRIAPRFGRHVLPMVAVAMTVAFMVPGWMPVPLAFAVAMGFVGGANGLLDVVMNARVSALEERAGLHLMNMNYAAYSFAYGFAAILTGALREAGWMPGQILMLVGLLVIAAAGLAVEGGQGVNSFSHTEGRRVRLGWLPFWGGLLAMLAFMAENASENWSALHIERSLGGSKYQGSVGPALLALTMGVGRTFGQILVAHVTEAHLIRWGAIIAALGTAMVGLAPGPGVAYVGLVMAGLGGSVLAPTAFAVMGRLSDPERRALNIARMTALGYMGYFFGPPCLGVLSGLVGLGQALVIMAVIILLILPLYPKLLRVGADQTRLGQW